MAGLPRQSSTSIPSSPAPWQLEGQAWVFFTHQPFSTRPVALPEGAYSPFELGTTFDLSDRFHGGTGAVMLVRYTHSPVGAYDELLYVPGYFSFTAQGEETVYRHVITRIYVSTAASVKNGRSNWGIPKHLANFQFGPIDGDKQSIRVTVAHPSSSSSPFFRAVLTQSRLTPFAFPISTSMIDSVFARQLTRGFVFQLVQPALPDPTSVAQASVKATADGEELSWLVDSSKTFIVKPVSSGKAKLCWIVPDERDAGGKAMIGFGDGKGFPSFKPVLGGRGSHLLSFDMVFPVPVELCSHQLG
ncbi:hypothetical protein ACM66B_003893 [Microbotryomycetes sp. NB124-2]